MLPEHFRLDVHPVAACDAIVRAGSARFTVLTDELVRLEYDPADAFEDRASQTMWHRQQSVPAFTVQQGEGRLIIETSAFRLSYAEGKDFAPDSLSIHVKATGADWHPGAVDEGNLKGTTRTLDFVNGYTRLNDGLISRSGWALLDDSRSLVFDEQGWLEPRAWHGADWYFFAYGHDYKAALRAYSAVSGKPPLIPRWILGNWWSRFWAYSQDELLQLLADFEAHSIPLSVCIVDMDWHLTQTGNRSTGWTGYTWNRRLFPDPQGFIDSVHAKGLRTALNLHPAEGIHPHEAQYPEMARRMGIDPSSEQPVAFDIADPAFVSAYFDVLHHPYEDMGVDFWWVDWQQGLDCKMAGLDPLWLINHLHFLDSGRSRSRRPFIFSRWGNEGHQRYPIGFSGDSYMSWDTLRFEPYMTATASNVAYGWWSHDIGGHISGEGDSELFARWVQFGALSPILRIHSTKGQFYDQRPWAFADANVRDALRDALQLRHALIPYLYTMAWRAHHECLPLMLPMYYEYPEDEAAYHCPQQYLFGSQLIAAPFVEPTNPDTRFSRQVVWLPEGGWFDVFSGEFLEGDRWHAIYGTLKDIPLFARAGAILPLGPQVGWGGVGNPDELHVHVFAGPDNTFILYEDDGESQDYLAGDCALTTIASRWSAGELELSVGPAQGNARLVPAERAVHAHIHGIKEAVSVTAYVDGDPVKTAASYEAATETLSVRGIPLTPTAALRLRVSAEDGSLLARRSRKRETLLRLLRAFRLHSGIRNGLADGIDTLVADPDAIAPFLVAMEPAHVRALCEVLYEAGIHHVPDTHHSTLLIVWNNRADEAITFRYGEAFLHFGGVKDARHENGTAPRFAAFTPNSQTWTHGALGEHVQRTQWQLQVDYHNLATVSEFYHERTP